ncbi:BNR-4 repeat-containing protein [Luteolibacter sp. LG18]|uniref:BNR-4 repeat-containing protein n=1 Tax=Luteolibacter sp. LG18 TaxID=2819286 RepID=UPI002B2A7BF1|nr:hypothetical protein llg_44380 [Luteolibacter sp. LG18]
MLVRLLKLVPVPLCLAVVLFSGRLHAQVTYVDASTGNTTKADGSSLGTPPATANLYTDSLWSIRTGLASGGTIFEAGGGEAAPVLRQTLTNVPAGTYDIHVFFWVSTGARWQINAGLNSGSLSNFYGYGIQTDGSLTTSPTGSTAYAGSSTYTGGSAPTTFLEVDRTLVRASIGQATVGANGILQVYVSVGPVTTGGQTGPQATRTWFDGVGYSVPIPLPGNAVEIAPDGAWTWFNDERSIIHQGSLYAGYMKANGLAGVTRYNLSTGTSQHMVLGTATSQQVDDHNNPSFTVLPDGRITALYSKHAGPAVFYQRTSTITQPSTDADWGAEQTRTVPASNTYANTYRLSGENNAIYNFHRCINFNPTLTISTDNGQTWGTSRQLVGTGSGSTRPYPRYCSNGVDRIDAIYTDGHPRDVNNSVYHLYYQNGVLRKTDGTAIKNLADIPLDHDGGERGSVIYQYSAAAWGTGQGPDDWIPTGRGWTWDVHYGKDNAPVCVFQVQKDEAAGTGWNNDRIYYYYARWTGTAWQKRFIAQGGRPIYSSEDDYGGGMCLDPEDPRIVYISTNAASPFSLGEINAVPLRSGEKYEIYRGFTADGGLTFTWTQITVNSTSDNLRPIVPVHHGRQECLVWFYGTYTSYTNYSAKVLGRIGAPVVSYADWAAGFGLSATSGNDDPDHDGQSNILEYALQNHPLSAQNAERPVLAGNTFQFSIDRSRADVEWAVLQSTDLVNWQEAAVIRSAGLPTTTAAGFNATVPDTTGSAAVSTVTPPAGGKSFFKLTTRAVR